MFAANTKEIVKCLSPEGNLIHHKNIQEIKMLTLVKVKVNPYWPTIKYKFSPKTLLDLLQEPDFTPEYTEEVVLEDFKNLSDRSIRGSAAAEVDVAKAKMEVSASVDTVDGVSSVTLKKKTVDTEKLKKSCVNKKIKEETVKDLRLTKNEKLAFIDETVFNTSPATFYGSTGKAGLVLGKKKSEINFTVPPNTTFAYSLMEITMDNNPLGIPLQMKEIRRHKKGWWGDSTDGNGDDETLQQLMKEVFEEADLLQPLAELHESRRCDLLIALRELLDDGDALSLLEETLGQSGKKRPQSPAVSSFMNLLDASGKSFDLKNAVHLLVKAMDALPDDAAVLLATCSPETLRVLQQLVNSLKEGAQAKLPESLPVSLQEEGELRWAAELLCLNDQTLTELRDQWDTPEFPPEVMLQLVCLVVQGLSLMQS